jgi:hypothetical protein
MGIGRYPLEQTPGTGFKSAQRPLLQTIGYRSHQQIAAET